jgi:hypothetical protein
MDRMTLRVVLGCLLGLLGLFGPATGRSLDFGTDTAVRAATFELYAPGTINGAKGLVGTAFAIGPNQFVTTAHLLDTAAGTRSGHPVLVDSRRVEYRIADILQFSEQHDLVTFSLQRPPRVRPLPIQTTESDSPELYFAGWRLSGVITTERGTFAGLTPDNGAAAFDWLRFSGPVWGAAGGGPVIDGTTRVIGIVQGVSLNGGANYAVPIGLLFSESPNRAQLRHADTSTMRQPNQAPFATRRETQRRNRLQHRGSFDRHQVSKHDLTITLEARPSTTSHCVPVTTFRA